MENRVKQLRLNHVHKIYYNKCPSYLHDKFVRVCQTHSYNSRNSSVNFHVPLVDSFTSKTFYYHAIQEWNCLPLKVKTLKNKYAFKKEVKIYLLEDMKCVEQALSTFY